MALEIENLNFVSGAANHNAPYVIAYKSSSDTLATIMAAGYFDEFQKGIASGYGILAKGDVIFVEGSDHYALLRINSVTGSVEVEYYDTPETDIDLADGKIFIGDATNKAAPQTMSGDATLSAAGVLTIGTDAVTTTKIADSNVTSDKIASANVTTDKIANENVTAAKIANDCLTGSKVDALVSEAQVGALPVLFYVALPGGATADTDITMYHKVQVIDAWVNNKSAGTAGDTVTVARFQDAAEYGITDAMDVNVADAIVTRASEIYSSKSTINAGAVLRLKQVDGAGDDSPPVDVFILAARVD